MHACLVARLLLGNICAHSMRCSGCVALQSVHPAAAAPEQQQLLRQNQASDPRGGSPPHSITGARRLGPRRRDRQRGRALVPDGLLQWRQQHPGYACPNAMQPRSALPRSALQRPSPADSAYPAAHTGREVHAHTRGLQLGRLSDGLLPVHACWRQPAGRAACKRAPVCAGATGRSTSLRVRAHACRWRPAGAGGAGDEPGVRPDWRLRLHLGHGRQLL